MLVVVGEVSCQLLSRIKVSICRELASSLETKRQEASFQKENEIVKNVVISWEQVVLMWWCPTMMSRRGLTAISPVLDLERKANGRAQL